VRYWWVNQNQTYRQEIAGGYLWSPKRNANGARNPFYEFMREVAPGDLVFSFVDTRIVAIGTIASYCYESPKPAEFGGVGLNWEAIGWRVRVNFVSLLNKIRPKDHIDVLRRVLPSRYSPLQDSGNGIQSVYLTEVPTPLAEILNGLIGKEAAVMHDRGAGSTLQTLPMQQQVENADLEMWEHHIESEIESNDQLLETEREALIVARRGQGLFKQRVMQVENRCRITGVTNPMHLRASHCKPWRDSSNEERINGENGLLLTPTVDHLFDRGFISFEDSGILIVSPVAHPPSLNLMGVATDHIINVGMFTQGQKQFLDYHRESVLLQARH
jgi:putative restriction endonuclease